MTRAMNAIVGSTAKNLLLLASALLMMSAAAARAGTPGAPAIAGRCAPRDARSDRLIANFKAFVGKADLGGTVEKKTMGLATVTPSQVALVTDEAICAKAAAAFDRKQLEKRSSYTLYVVSLGSSFGVEDTRMLQAGFETADVFDSDWKYIGVRQIH